LSCDTRLATDGRQALEEIAARAPDLVLLDIMMPEMDGFEVLARLKDNEAWREIPVIVISAVDDIDSVARGIRMGAEDYLTKPFEPIVLQARIVASLERKRLRDRELLHMQRINEELALAWQVQSGFLPAPLPAVPGWQLAAALQPSRETSGDFYDFIALPEGKLGILVADVSDKGMGAALFMVLSRTLMRTFAADSSSPREVLRDTNRRILADIHTDQFVTAFYGILDPVSGTLDYCSAGHTPAYVLSAHGGGGVAHSMPCSGMPLGVLEDEDWEQRTVQMTCGDSLVIYTDGVTDAQDPRGEFFGSPRLCQVLQANLGGSALDVQRSLLSALAEFVQGAPQTDDITVAVVVREQRVDASAG
jgi:sigma-B regulation protein RsbU (phosphoserine phosphatase)